MNSNQYISLTLLALCLSLVTCGSTPQNQPPKRAYYEGNGGKGISLAILAPKATGLSKEQEYIPSLIQGEFVSNFTGYSAIAVLDRQRLDEQYAELLSGYYDDNSHVNEYGKTIATASRLFFQWVALLEDRRNHTIIEGDVEKLVKRNWDTEGLGRENYRISETKRYINRMNQPVVFSGVSADDITDNLTVKIISINGIDAETAGKTGYIRISTF